MRYQLNLPIEFDYARGGYHFTKTITDLPLFQLAESELVSVFVAQKALEAYRGTPFEQPLRTAFRNFRLQQATPASELVSVGKILAQASLFAISARVYQISRFLLTWRRRSRSKR
jgi:proteasome accessory factor B